MPLPRLLLVVAALFVAGPAFAADKPRPNTLTPKEIADGWLLLFDGETTFGWKVDGEAKVKDGVFLLGGEKATTATLTTGLSAYELRMETGGAGSVVFKDVSASCSLGLANQPTRLNVKVRTGPGGSGVGSNLNVGPDGVARVDAEVTTAGPPAVEIVVPAGGKLTVHSVKLKPAGLKPLFNGKSLDGWKVFDGDPKRAATKFEVTRDGELGAKNGPGDLQTEKQFDNFVLQLECKTNGKWLNSGIFFRCLPNQYQQGYETQIQNGYLGDDRSKPVDYGTGAIYRRVAARKVVSNDNEWFTMTVVANGPHIATWVNGYQTVAWTDDRKPADNARQGLKTGKGHLSIQGHDPTTDLLFRNIRIAELPAAAGKKD
ncbi:MAG: hypothetical protein JWO38_365 [Gemmataceae bacterium]|nr:hypothetical protein [Gemmataceae bacterium]